MNSKLFPEEIFEKFQGRCMWWSPYFARIPDYKVKTNKNSYILRHSSIADPAEVFIFVYWELTSRENYLT